MYIRRLTVVLAVGAAMLGAIACGSDDRLKDDNDADASAGDTTKVEKVEFPLTITDAYGTEHTFDKPVTKPGMVEGSAPLALAELGVRPWADSNTRAFAKLKGKLFYPKGFAKHSGVNFEDPEAWLQTGAEVIFAPGPPQPWNKAIRQTGKVFFLHHPDNETSDNDKGTDVFYANYRLVAKVVNRQAEAEKVIERFESFVAELKEHAPPDAADHEIQLLDETTDGTYFLAGQPDSPYCKMLEENELGKCVAPPDWNEQSWQLNAESLLAVNPEWIGYVRAVDESSWKDRNDAVWKRLDAVKKGQVFDIDGLWLGLGDAQWFLQKYAHHVWGEEGGIPEPVPQAEYVPTDSPLDNAA